MAKYCGLKARHLAGRPSYPYVFARRHRDEFSGSTPWNRCAQRTEAGMFSGHARRANLWCDRTLASDHHRSTDLGFTFKTDPERSIRRRDRRTNLSARENRPPMSGATRCWFGRCAQCNWGLCRHGPNKRHGSLLRVSGPRKLLVDRCHRIGLPPLPGESCRRSRWIARSSQHQL